MAGTTRFLLTNRLLTATLKNGTGGGAPARDETSPFTMEKLQNADRLDFWKSSAAPTYNLTIDWDLGSNTSITCAALHAYEGVGGGLVSSCLVQYATAAAGYPPAGWTTAGTIPSLLLGPRDAGVVFAAASARYWRFELETGSGQVAIGRMALGSYLDLGQVSSGGYRPRVYGNRLETRMENGDPCFDVLNANLATDFLLPFRDIDSTVAANLASLTAQQGSFTMFDYNDAVHEVWLADMELEGALNWYAGTAASELWDHDLRLRGYA